jgi:hypothetical protein
VKLEERRGEFLLTDKQPSVILGGAVGRSIHSDILHLADMVFEVDQDD